MITQTPIDNMLRLAKEHHLAGRLGPAEDLYREIISHQPNHPDALHSLGVIAYQVGKPEIAVAFIQKSLRLDPDNALAYKNLSAAMKAAGRYADAVDIARRAIELAPLEEGGFTNLGNALSELGRLDDALAAYRRAVELQPNCAKVVSNLGGCLVDLGRFDEAIAAHRRAVELQPDLGAAHWNLALAMLSKGDFDGWKEYEWRWKFDGFTSVPRNFQRPLWSGQPIAGQRLLLHAEQGLGDTIQFIRYLPRIADRIGSGEILLECQPRLLPLLRQCREVQTFIPAGDPLPDFDLHCPLMSLPLALNDRLETIPQAVPYLRPDPKLVQEWADVFGGGERRWRVGLAWAGSSTNRHDHHRSLRLPQLASLASVAGVEFFSLQIDAQVEMAAGHFPNLIDTTARQTDFAQTAACIAHLDAVITVDTSLAHLAGAMNKPTWILLPFSADWRWMRERDDSPWCPSARLFRQRTPGEWDEPIQRVREQLLAAAVAEESRVAIAPQGHSCFTR